jgi:hypothetical protein
MMSIIQQGHRVSVAGRIQRACEGERLGRSVVHFRTKPSDLGV